MKCSYLGCEREATTAVSVHNAPNYAVCDDHAGHVAFAACRPLDRAVKVELPLSALVVYQCRTCGAKIDPNNAFEVYRPWREILCGDCT